MGGCERWRGGERWGGVRGGGGGGGVRGEGVRGVGGGTVHCAVRDRTIRPGPSHN